MILKNLFFAIALLFATTVFAQDTYSIGSTEYYFNQTYSTTGKPMVKRSASNKTAFLKSNGYSSTPYGYEIDHIVPLSQGGSDDPSNMQLLSVQQHRAKTARERSSSSSNSYFPSSSATSTYRVPSTPSIPAVSRSTYSYPSSYSTPSTSSSSTRVLQTGSRGGTYYINSNGNKTYVKKS
jgi:hypothetical protein